MTSKIVKASKKIRQSNAEKSNVPKHSSGRKPPVQTDVGIWSRLVGGKPGQFNRIAPWWLWREVLIGHYNESLSRKLPERSYNLYSNDRTLMSGRDNVTAILSIDGYSSTLPLDFKENLKNRSGYNVQVNFLSFSNPTQIHWTSPEMKSRMKNYKRQVDELGEVGVFDYQENISEISRQSWLQESIKYLANADTARGVQMFDYYSHILVTGVRGEEFDESVERIKSYCEKQGLTVNRVNRHHGKFLRTFSPATLGMEGKTLQSVGKNVLPDEIIARFSPYDQGKIGQSGVCLGVDIQSNYPILKKFKKDDVDPENILVLAETGWGKSFFVKYQLFQLLANKRVRGTIMDIEGAEYLPLASFFSHEDDVVVLNMAEGSGAYFDPVSIARSGDEVADREQNVYGLSRSYTTVLFRTLVGEENLKDLPWADVIIKDAVAKTYADAGVKGDDYDTWGNADNLTLHDVYANIKGMHQSAFSDNSSARNTDPAYRANLNLVVALTGQYFEKPEQGGLLSDTFKNRVPLRTVANAKLVLCSFGMASRSTTTVDPIQMALTQLSAANISHIRSLFCKAEGKFNLKVWEELQRWASFPGSEEILNVAVTGGRKMGDINFVISNEPRMFLGVGAKLGVFSNITSFMVGAIADATVRREIAEALSVPELYPDLSILVNEAGDIETFNEETTPENESVYRRAFLMKLDKSVVTFGKVRIPSHIAKSMLFRTGSVEVVDDLQSVEEEIQFEAEGDFDPFDQDYDESSWESSGFLDEVEDSTGSWVDDRDDSSIQDTSDVFEDDLFEDDFDAKTSTSRQETVTNVFEDDLEYDFLSKDFFVDDTPKDITQTPGYYDSFENGVSNGRHRKD